MLDGFPQRDFVLWVFMCPINISLSCFYFCFFSVSILCLYISRLPRRGLPRPIYTARAITPLPPLHGYHACVYLSRLPRHSSFLYPWVITPGLSLSTTLVHRVITPGIVVRILQFTFHRLLRHLFFSTYTTTGSHTYQPTPQPCTHRSVHCAYSINDFSTLCQQYLTKACIVSTSPSSSGWCVNRWTSSPALSTPLDSSTRDGVKTCPKREFQR